MSARVHPRQREIAPADRARLFEVASLLLTYPDAELRGAAAELAAAVAEIGDDEVRGQLTRFLVWFAASEGADVEQHYVRTFDLRRRSGLYLTYYLHGDTRKRGLALLTLKQRYRAHGLRLRDGELPDLLPVVLEFAAVAGPGDGEAPLRQHRQGLELLRLALVEAGSPYRDLLDAVVLALPPLTDADREAVAALAADGPPVEAVGLAAYGDELAGVGLGPAPAGPTAGSLAPCSAHPATPEV
ncbi:nitrate reductase molybdenum cofactor assembly chaperone [Nocardioides ferulae]|uniref:nitrate reductase molybdenum cofactor assembly chaperone n=1 Tax=Nocardioides ferulae TaxID=2340821 RepID=UPI00197F2BBF|nr:nitrate reductase molybdenum cofactor assembly chaperone [Nocardioides ferulae]